MPTVIGLFDDAANLQRALDALYRQGFDEDIQVIDHTGSSSAPGVPAADDARLSPAIGAAPVATDVAATPGRGPVPLPFAGLFDALTGLDVPEEEARFFGEALKEDAKLIVVRTGDDRAGEVYKILRQAKANRTNEPS